MRLAIGGASLIGLTLSGMFGQSTAPVPAFEVASVKPDLSPKDPIGLFTWPGGRIVASNYTLRMLIHDAWNLEMYQILGGPLWADDDRYTVEAKPPASSESGKWVPDNFKTSPNPEMRQMMQTLLADRFQLKVHKESKKGFVYALVVVRGGPKLKAPIAAKQPFVGYGRTGSTELDAASLLITGQNATMEQLTTRLATLLKRPVLDQTGLNGHFDFRVEYAANETQSDAAPSLLRVLQEQLGLKLETQPGSVGVLVIDHVEKPNAN